MPTVGHEPRFLPVLKKIVLLLLLSCVLLVGGFYLAGSWLLASGTRALLPRLAATTARTGLRIDTCDFRTAQVRPLARLGWSDWTIAVTRAARPGSAPAAPLQFRVGRIRLAPATWAPLTVDLAVEEVALASPFVPDTPADLPFASAEYGVRIEAIDAGRLTLAGLPVSADVTALAAALANDLQTLARDGRTARALDFGARLHFRLNGEPLTVRLETERRQGVTRLRFNASDVAELSRRYNRRLTPNEQAILCEYPQRSLLLLRIKEYAEHLSQRLARTDRAYGEDFTRHVIWSYWLTRTFGAEFAEQVTDAHEAGATDNTEAEHQQDFANNRVGRSYAAARKSESQVLRLIKTDPMIIRTAR